MKKVGTPEFHTACPVEQRGVVPYITGDVDFDMGLMVLSKYNKDIMRRLSYYVPDYEANEQDEHVVDGDAII